MTLTLTVRGLDALENGAPTEFVLHRRGGSIGRAPTCDWSLPDPRRHISSHHCDILFRDESYILTDLSTNGTFLNGATERMQGPRVIASGDRFQIGHYELVAELSGSALAALEPESDTSGGEAAWKGWDSQFASAAPSPSPPGAGEWDDEPYVAPHAASPPAAGLARPGGGWDELGGAADPRPPIAPASAGASERWAAATPPVAPSPQWDPSHRAQIAAASPWSDPEPAPEPPSAWSSAAPDRPPPPSADDVWGRIAEGNIVDWARCGFGAASARRPDLPGLSTPDEPAADPRAAPPAPDPARRRPAADGAQDVAEPRADAHKPPADRPDAGDLAREFLAAAGLGDAEIPQAGPRTVIAAAALLRRLVAGLVVLVEARARAKAQMGAEGTRLEFDGNNPIKFARVPEQALARLLSPRERGFMDAEAAVEDAFFDLQSHQMATLKAMQGALKATLDRFSPDAIRRRTGAEGMLAKVLPQARDAALWRKYEREFSGVARGSDEAFMDVFAKEFRKAYEEQAAQRR
ncbi:MAG: type VI secretion system-associated FHA domain protein TagH [Alphaproteobacteria bacterium]|nr:type VI secretion system-associated FHA domain protein TagH [Alphaproteobacteria bacterium]